MSFIAGYLSSISVNGSALQQWSSDASLSKTTEAVDGTTLGLTHKKYVNGQKDTNMSVTMHLDTASLVLLQAADDSTTPIAVVFKPGENPDHDAGSYSGDGIITDLTIAGGFEDNWSVAMEVQGTAEWPYTAPA